MTPEKLAHISDAEVLQDIADTEAEIAKMRHEEPLLRALGDRWSVMRADARISGIREREEFVRQLRELLESRAQST